MTQINRIVREEIKQKERALPEDGNKEEKRNIMEYVSKCLNTRLLEEANDTQKNTLLTLFSQCSSCDSFFFFLILVSDPAFYENHIFIIYRLHSTS